jgi:uncharacterized protein YjbJ (UPF0337 family)
MNKDKLLSQLKAEAKEQWGKLTNDPSTETEGKPDKARLPSVGVFLIPH